MQQVLASIATTDFGIWSKEVKQVQKTKLPSRGLCCSWTSDGTVRAVRHFCRPTHVVFDTMGKVLAIGLFGGDVLIYDRSWGEKDLKATPPPPPGPGRPPPPPPPPPPPHPRR
jgi:hypothetical protein